MPLEWISLEISQGRVLGPLVFLLYVNDIYHMISGDSFCKLTVHADDTNILANGESMSDLEGMFILMEKSCSQIMKKYIQFYSEQADPE